MTGLEIPIGIHQEVHSYPTLPPTATPLAYADWLGQSTYFHEACLFPLDIRGYSAYRYSY